MFCLPKKWLFPSPATCAETPGFVLEAARRWHIFKFSTIPVHGFCFQVFLPVAQSFFSSLNTSPLQKKPIEILVLFFLLLSLGLELFQGISFSSS